MSGSESKIEMQKKRDRKLETFQNIDVKSCICWSYNKILRNVRQLAQFVTTVESGIKSTIILVPENVKISDCFSFLKSKILFFLVKTQIQYWRQSPRVFFMTAYRPQFTQEVFENVAFASGKPPTSIIKHRKQMTILGEF